MPRKLSADAGYFSAKSVRWLESVGVERYIATGRQKHVEAPPKVRCVFRGMPSTDSGEAEQAFR
ncbi:hypothetical protein [Myxococcus xanthus]|uniref:hypothetical protein n=1 Tax=Myxococcus xanthus TaxID=34 RepID=UPI001126CF54|nr:hypothetical protein [Myxococcus xanthus]